MIEKKIVPDIQRIIVVRIRWVLENKPLLIVISWLYESANSIMKHMENDEVMESYVKSAFFSSKIQTKAC